MVDALAVKALIQAALSHLLCPIRKLAGLMGVQCGQRTQCSVQERGVQGCREDRGSLVVQLSPTASVY